MTTREWIEGVLARSRAEHEVRRGVWRYYHWALSIGMPPGVLESKVKRLIEEGRGAAESKD